MPALQIALAQGVDHRRGIGRFEQAVGIGTIGKIGGTDAMLSHKGLFPHSTAQAVAAVVVAIDLAASTGKAAQFLLPHRKEALLAAHNVEQLARQINAHALQAGKGNAIG